MKTTDASEVRDWEHTHGHEVQGRGSAQSSRGPLNHSHLELAAFRWASDGVDGSDELAPAVGEGACGVRVAIRISCALDAGQPAHEAKEAGECRECCESSAGKSSDGGDEIGKRCSGAAGIGRTNEEGAAGRIRH